MMKYCGSVSVRTSRITDQFEGEGSVFSQWDEGVTGCPVIFKNQIYPDLDVWGGF